MITNKTRKHQYQKDQICSFTNKGSSGVTQNNDKLCKITRLKPENEWGQDEPEYVIAFLDGSNSFGVQEREITPIYDNLSIRKKTNAIDAILESAHFINPPNTDELEDSIKSTSDRITKAESLLKDCLKSEKKAIDEIDTILKIARDNLQRLQNEKKQIEARSRIGEKFKVIDFVPLAWRDTEGFPKLVIFHIEQPEFRVYRDLNHFKIDPHLPVCARKHFENLSQFLGDNKKIKAKLKYSAFLTN